MLSKLTFLVEDTTPFTSPKTWLVLAGMVLILQAVYRMGIYPYFFSPLHHLPGPKDHYFLFGQPLNQYLYGDPNEPYLT